MPIKSKYLFIASMDVDADKDAIFNEVYDTEHIPNLLRVPGVRSVNRLKGEPSGAPREARSSLRSRPTSSQGAVTSPLRAPAMALSSQRRAWMPATSSPARCCHFRKTPIVLLAP